MSAPLVTYTTHPTATLTVKLTEPFLDITVQDSVRQTIDAAWREGLSCVVVDCSHVEFMDSSGVGLMIALHKRLGGGIGRVILQKVRPAIRGVFKLLCLEDLFVFEA